MRLLVGLALALSASVWAAMTLRGPAIALAFVWLAVAIWLAFWGVGRLSATIGDLLWSEKWGKPAAVVVGLVGATLTVLWLRAVLIR